MSTKTLWEPRTTYLYLVCLITLVMVIVATVGLVRGVFEVIYPEPQLEAPIRIANPPGETAPQMDEAELEAQQQHQRQWSIRSAVLNVAGNVAMLLVAGPLYAYHWRKVRGG